MRWTPTLYDHSLKRTYDTNLSELQLLSGYSKKLLEWYSRVEIEG